MENTAYRNAMELLARRRSQAEKDAALRREELYQSLPQLREYDGKAAALCRQMTTAVINGEPIEAYQKGLEQVQRDKLHTLAAAGIEEELLRPQYPVPGYRLHGGPALPLPNPAAAKGSHGRPAGWGAGGLRGL
mgnify:CR=1 FL=1